MGQGIKVVYTKYKKKDMRVREKVAKKKKKEHPVFRI